MRLLSSSDHHTLHRRLPTKHVLKNLSQFMYTDVDLNKVDIALFTGDIFDRSVENSNPEFLSVLEWFKQFFKRCEDTKTVVRIVEGTSLHDWEQSKHIMLTASDKVDVKYFNELSIEVFPQFDNLSVMYVPDNMASKSPDEIWELALSVLAKHNLEKVDLIALHGGFYYQLPEKGRKHAHMESRWKTIVQYGIFSGHIHVPSSYENFIFSNGSFDRCRHGEEHKKGAWIIDLDLKTKYFKPTFWENKNALPFVTIKIDKEALPEDIVPYVKGILRKTKYPKGSQFRLSGGHKSIISPIISALEIEFDTYGFKDDSESDDAIIDQELYSTTEYEGVSLDKGNLADYALPDVMTTLSNTDISEDEVRSVLKEFL